MCVIPLLSPFQRAWRKQGLRCILYVFLCFNEYYPLHFQEQKSELSPYTTLKPFCYGTSGNISASKMWKNVLNCIHEDFYFFFFWKKQTLNPAIIQIWNSIQIFQLHTKRDNKIPSQRDTSGIYEIQFGADLIYEQDKKLSYLCLNKNRSKPTVPQW